MKSSKALFHTEKLDESLGLRLELDWVLVIGSIRKLNFESTYQKYVTVVQAPYSLFPDPRFNWLHGGEVKSSKALFHTASDEKLDESLGLRLELDWVLVIGSIRKLNFESTYQK